MTFCTLASICASSWCQFWYTYMTHCWPSMHLLTCMNVILKIRFHSSAQIHNVHMFLLSEWCIPFFYRGNFSPQLAFSSHWSGNSWYMTGCFIKYSGKLNKWSWFFMLWGSIATAGCVAIKYSGVKQTSLRHVIVHQYKLNVVQRNVDVNLLLQDVGWLLSFPLVTKIVVRYLPFWWQDLEDVASIHKAY